MIETASFGDWIAQRRKLLDFTQRELAVRANCALATIKKIEIDERRPSRELAQALADALQIPRETQLQFIECARGLAAVDLLANIGVGAASHATAPAPGLAAGLPIRGAVLVGRDTALAQITRLLSQPACRLLTLVGVGGVGKTRLAAEIAYQQREHFADGSAFVALAAVADAAQLPLTIASALNLPVSGQVETQLFAYLQDKSLLLVLDNCEQLVDGISWLATLLAAAPGVKLLATSRERLQLAEEWVYTVPMLKSEQAIDLFCQLAQRHDPQFEPAEQGIAVAEICRLVENLPLAIELAASWAPYASCEQIAANIQRDIDFLTANARSVPERHRSIRAVFDHSWQLLSPASRAVLMRLSVFRGGWEIEEAHQLAGATLFSLRTLMEKSLIRIAGPDRYDMHDLIRQYAEYQLENAGLAEQAIERHAAAYFALAGQLDSAIAGPNGIAAFMRFDREHDNLRAGLRWAVDTGHREIAQQYVDRLFMYWLRRGYWAEGERWAKAAAGTADEGDSIYLCWALLDAAVFISLQGRFGEAYPYRMRAESMAKRLDDPETDARLLLILGQALPDFDEAAAAFEKLFVTCEQVEVPAKGGVAWNSLLANAHVLYGDRLRQTGQLELGKVQYQRSLDLYRRLGNVDLVAYPIGNLGRLKLHAGHFEEAYASFQESVRLSRAVGNRVGIADWLQQLGHAALALGDLAQAQSCYEEALALYQEIGNQRACPAVLAGLGFVAYLQNDLFQAKTYLRDSLTGFRLVVVPLLKDFNRWTTELQQEFVLCLQTCARVETAEEHLERAVTLFGAANSGLETPIYYGRQLGVASALSTLRSRLADDQYARAWARGESMSAEAVLAYALE